VSPKATSVAEADHFVVSSAIAAICGADPASADRYEARNDALRSIMRERHLPTNDVAALTDWLASTNDVLRVERLAALKNDVSGEIARIAAVQLAGERGYAEALPLLRATLSSARRDAVTDVVCIGSLGLLGTADDIPLLRRFAALGPRYAPAAETAIRRIEEREGGTEL
jgi:hypothetical protein